MTIYEYFELLDDEAGDLRYSKEGLTAIYDTLSLIKKSSLAEIQVLKEEAWLFLNLQKKEDQKIVSLFKKM